MTSFFGNSTGIKSVNSHESVSVITDVKGDLWVIGPNGQGRLGVESPRSMKQPVKTSISLRDNETVRTIYAYKNLFCIRTTERLFISHFIRPSSLQSNSSNSDNPGLWLNYQNTIPRGTDAVCVNYRNNPGFYNPVEDVKSACFIDETVIIRKSDGIYAFRWDYAIGSYTNNHEPIFHHEDFVYFKLTDNVIRARFRTEIALFSNSNETFFIKPDAEKLAVCVKTDKRLFNLDRIYRIGNGYVGKKEGKNVGDDILIEINETGKLVKIQEDGYRHFILNADLPSRSVVATFYSDDYFDESNPSDWFGQKVTIPGRVSTFRSHNNNLFVINNTVLYVNLKHVDWYLQTNTGVIVRYGRKLCFYCHEESLPIRGNNFFEKRYRIDGNSGFNIFEREWNECIKIASTGTGCFVIRSSKDYHYIFFKDMVHVCQRIILDPTIKPDMGLIKYNKLSELGHQTFAVINEDDMLRALCYISVNNKPDKMFSILLGTIIDKQQTFYASGFGVSRDLCSRAVKQFVKEYLIIRDNSCTFNIPAFQESSPSFTSIIGRALHLAILVLGSSLPLRMPVAFYVALKGRELTTDELECLIVDEKMREELIRYRDDPNIENVLCCSYKSYLWDLVGYDPTDKSSQIAELLAMGFFGLQSIPNFHHMNVATVEKYICASSVIDREQFKSQIVYRMENSSPYQEFIEDLIDNSTDTELDNLLLNWSGSSVLSSSDYSVLISNDSGGVEFITCSKMIALNPTFFRESREDLRSMLLVPITSLRH